MRETLSCMQRRSSSSQNTDRTLFTFEGSWDSWGFVGSLGVRRFVGFVGFVGFVEWLVRRVRRFALGMLGSTGRVRLQADRDPGAAFALSTVMMKNNPGHLKTFSYVGVHRYSLTFCTDRRQRLFSDAAVVELVLQQLVRSAREQKFAIPAYCFMPDHLHVLSEGVSEDSDCKRFMKAFKQYSGYYYSQKYRNTLWQRYGFEHVLRDEEVTITVAKYILANPV